MPPTRKGTLALKISTKLALQPLADIWSAYLANRLDDEARRFWGPTLEFENQRPMHEIILYSGRGGKTLLTLQDCRNAFIALNGDET
jgi:hypothetical protein